MYMNITSTGAVRINITVPGRLLSELKKEVPERGKSSFISEAIVEKLARKRRENALKEIAKLPVSFTNIKEDSAEYIANERVKEDSERSVHLGI